MKIFNCLIILALIVAATASACHKKVPHKHRHCKAIDKSWYLPPKHSNKKALSVFGFVAKGLKSTLKNAIGIFNFYSRRVIPKTVDRALEAVLNISKAISFVLNVWIDTIGTIFANIVMAISKIVFCVLGTPWNNGLFFDKMYSHKSCKGPAICGKDYGKRFGWGFYSGKYESYRDILEFYGLVDLDIDLLIKKHNGVGIKGLVGTKLVVANSIVSLYHLLCRDIKHWKRDDIVLANKYVVTVAAAIGKGYHADIGVDIVDGFFLYINAGFKASGFVDISTYRDDIVKELDTCSAESWNGAVTTLYEGDDDDDDKNGGIKGGNENKDNGNNGQIGGDSKGSLSKEVVVKKEVTKGGNENKDNCNNGQTGGDSKGSLSKEVVVKKEVTKVSSSSNAENENISSHNVNESSASAAAIASATAKTSKAGGATVNESNVSAGAASKSESKSSDQSSFSKSFSSSSSQSEFEWKDFSTVEESKFDSS